MFAVKDKEQQQKAFASGSKSLDGQTNSAPQIRESVGSLRTLQRNLGNSHLQAIAPTITPMAKDAEGLRLQRACGNSCAKGDDKQILQPKLVVGSPYDVYEQEADRVADQVMRMAEPSIQRQTQSEEKGKEEIIQRKEVIRETPEVSPEVESQIHSREGGGQPLPEGSRNFFEPRFGVDFGNVRIHIDTVADQLNRTLKARAFTTGRSIFFRQGEFNPDSHSGGELLAHELTHVLQQGGGLQRKSTSYEPRDRKECSRNSIRTLENEDDSEIETSIPSIQRDFAIEPPNPTADAAPLTDAQVQTAIQYNTIKLGGADAALIGTLRDVLGIEENPPVIDEDFANAVARWQAANNLPQDGKLGPNTAAPLFRELRAEGLTAESRTLASLVRRGRIRVGPTYTPNGIVAATVAGGSKRTTFTFAAEFEHDPANGIWASCCEVHQELEWDAAAAASFTAITGNPVPHNGFPAAHPAGTRIEDRNAGDTQRYGHRRAFGGGGAGNRYVNADGTLNQANGVRFEGRDSPGGPSAVVGQWRFRLSVVDVCNESRQIGGTDNITINW